MKCVKQVLVFVKKQTNFDTLLTHLLPIHPFTTPWKQQKALRFSHVLWARERLYLEQIG